MPVQTVETLYIMSMVFRLYHVECPISPSCSAPMSMTRDITCKSPRMNRRIT
jgi:hypothetical protein